MAQLECRAMRNSLPLNLLLGLIWVCLISSLGCSNDRDKDVLAVYHDHQLTISDLDSYLIALPESARQFPVGELAADVMEGHIRKLALQRILETSPRAQELQSGFDLHGQAQWHRAVALVGLLAQELARAAEPNRQELEARMDEMRPALAGEPVMNFQHVYFRLDRSLTPGNREEIRQTATGVAELAAAGSDFTELVRKHSDSAAAQSGGFVMNVRPSDLDEAASVAIRDLAEGDVSGVVETRTGLHIFRLIRRLAPLSPAPGQLESSARDALMRDRFAESREKLLVELRNQAHFDTSSTPWKIGDFTLSATALSRWVPDLEDSRFRDQIVDQFLLATEAIHRGLEPDNLISQTQERASLELLEAAFNAYRREFDKAVPAEDLRRYFEANSDQFMSAEKVDLELIFIPQGNDSFETKRHAEDLVETLRDGGDFASLAYEHSSGPGTDDGQLGSLDRSQVARLGPPIQAAVDDLKIGAISDPIYCTGRVLSHDPWMLRGGFAILRVKARTLSRPQSLDEAIDQVRRAYAFEHRDILDQSIEDKLLADAGFRLLRTPEVAEFQ